MPWVAVRFGALEDEGLLEGPGALRPEGYYFSLAYALALWAI